jgi:hypothetical protein
MSCNDGLFTKKKDELVKIVKQFNKDIPVSKLNKSKLLCLILELTEKAQPKPSQKVEPKPQPKPSQKVEPKQDEPKQDELNVNDFKKTKWLSTAVGQYYYKRKINIPYSNKMSGDDLRKVLIDRKTDLIKLADEYIHTAEKDLESHEEIAEKDNDKSQASLAKKVRKELDEFISRVGSKGMKQIEEMRNKEKEEYKKRFEAQMAKMTPQQKKKRDELIKADEEAKQQTKTRKVSPFKQVVLEERKKIKETQKKISQYYFTDTIKNFIRNDFKAEGGLKEHLKKEKEFKDELLNLPEGKYKEHIKEIIAYNLEEMYSEDGSGISESFYNFLRDFAKEYIEED